ncbi:MAG: PIG-L family deacetylase [Anaerolineales bacterium]|nr:PIG-L family deacetylase [Anaerolineales bacterium]
MRHIYLSPHLDDAVLSCGGVIAMQREAGIPVEIWNIMSGNPPADAPLSQLAQSVHAEWGTASAKETLALRLKEDSLAACRVDAAPRYFDFLDCIYRHAPDGTALYTDDIFLPPHTADTPLVGQIAERLCASLRAEDTLVCPLTIGDHPDHVIVRRAAEQTGHPLRYYADIPYMLWHPEQLDLKKGNLSAKPYPLTEEGMLLWTEAVAAYASQIGVLFGGEEKMRNEIRSYWQTIRGICLWGNP